MLWRGPSSFLRRIISQQHQSQAPLVLQRVDVEVHLQFKCLTLLLSRTSIFLQFRFTFHKKMYFVSKKLSPFKVADHSCASFMWLRPFVWGYERNKICLGEVLSNTMGERRGLCIISVFQLCALLSSAIFYLSFQVKSVGCIHG